VHQLSLSVGLKTIL